MPKQALMDEFTAALQNKVTTPTPHKQRRSNQSNKPHSLSFTLSLLVKLLHFLQQPFLSLLNCGS